MRPGDAVPCRGQEAITLADGAQVRPRRAASARLDLALALLAADQPGEAAATALEAVTSGRLVPSNYWRAAEVLAAVKAHRVPEAAELSEAYRELCTSAEAGDDGV